MDENDVRQGLQGLVDIHQSYLTQYGVEINSTQFSVRSAQRTEVNRRAIGCWECGANISTDDNQPWTADHIPPRNLNERYKAELPLLEQSYLLFPQCQDCSSQQSTLIRKLNSCTDPVKTTIANLSAEALRLLVGGKGNYIYGTKNLANDAQGLAIQELGTQNGCHSCSNKFPASRYIADHYPPQEAMTNYGQLIFKHFGVEYPRQFYLIPHCPRCSNSQGSKVKVLFQEASRLSGIHPNR